MNISYWIIKYRKKTKYLIKIIIYVNSIKYNKSIYE